MDSLYQPPPPILYAAPKSADIPVIDCDRSRPIDDVAADFRVAATEIGFLYVKNHGIHPSVMAAAFDASARFFSLPIEAKARVARNGGSNARGWEGLEEEPQTGDSASAPDHKESWNISLRGNPLKRPVNKWPAELADREFREPMMTYFLAIANVADYLLHVFARSLDLDAEYFDPMFVDGVNSLRCLRYPPHPENPKFNQLGAGAHTDAPVLTLLAQDDAGGLEVQNTKGEWLRADVIPGTLVVNLGDCAMRWTNGKYRSTYHRVKNAASDRFRYSMAFFYAPANETVIECLPGCLEPGQTPRFDPVAAGEYTAARLARNR